ncbi:Nn.00g007380.m01.CDS01 [Neocucurbitaria sp. VM-36]
MDINAPSLGASLRGLFILVVQAAAYALCHKEVATLLTIIALWAHQLQAMPAINFIDDCGDALSWAFGTGAAMMGTMLSKALQLMNAAYGMVGTLTSTMGHLNALAALQLEGAALVLAQNLIDAIILTIFHSIETIAGYCQIASALQALIIHGASVLLPYLDTPVFMLKYLLACCFILIPCWLVMASMLQGILVVWRWFRGPEAT